MHISEIKYDKNEPNRVAPGYTEQIAILPIFEQCYDVEVYTYPIVEPLHKPHAYDSLKYMLTNIFLNLFTIESTVVYILLSDVAAVQLFGSCGSLYGCN